MNAVTAALRVKYAEAIRAFRNTTTFPNTWHPVAQVSTLMNAHNQTNATVEDLLNMVLILAKRIEVLEDEAERRNSS
jgi:hypothetical protein